MKRALLTVMMSTALLAAMPALALARHHEHHKRHHHARVRHDHVGSDSVAGTLGTQPPVGTVGDQQDAGTVTSFGGGRLVITLNDHSMLSGAVTSATELKCEAQDPAEMQAADQGPSSDSGSGSGAQGQGDNGGQGSNGGSGDNGDQGDDQGPGDEQNGNTCTPVPGMHVQEADLAISSAGAVWNEVELSSQP